MGKTKDKTKSKKAAKPALPGAETAETAAPSDVAETAALQTGAAQTGAAQTGAAQTGAALKPEVHRAWAALLRSHALWVERIERRVRAQDGLSLEAYDVLLMLSYAPEGRLRMGALYQAVTLSRSGLTRLVDRLEKDGLVHREVCPNDRRSFEAILTPAGEAERARSWPLYAQAIAEEFGQFFSASEARSLAELLEKPLSMGGNSCCGRTSG